MKEGGFNLQKFVSSSPKLQQDIDRQEGIVESTTEDDTYARSTLGRSSTPSRGEHMILGVLWNVDRDQLVFDLKAIAIDAKDPNPTKRKVVRTVSKFFDPALVQ